MRIWKDKIVYSKHKVCLTFCVVITNKFCSLLVRTLENAKSTGIFDNDLEMKEVLYNETESDTSDMESSIQQRRPKKLKSFH